MVYGQFRNFRDNLQNNIQMLEPIFKNNRVHAFILTDKSDGGNYSLENEKEIIEIFVKNNFIIHMFAYTSNDFSENLFVSKFFKLTKSRFGIENDFVPKLIYRKYLLNKLTNEFLEKNKIPCDLMMYCRFFDIKITNNIEFHKITDEINTIYKNPNMLLGSSDTLFIGSKNAINFLFSLALVYENLKIYDDNIWDSGFTDFLSTMDICLCVNKMTYAPEVQAIYHIYQSNFKYKNIRVDFNNPGSIHNKNALYNVILDPKRKIFV